MKMMMIANVMRVCVCHYNPQSACSARRGSVCVCVCVVFLSKDV